MRFPEGTLWVVTLAFHQTTRGGGGVGWGVWAQEAGMALLGLGQFLVIAFLEIQLVVLKRT